MIALSNATLRRLVKLNNPLMGTETVCNSQYLLNSEVKVKLNNPLMGTETYYIFCLSYTEIHLRVKLNNPLMGTETEHTYIYIRHIYCIQLN